MKHRLTKFLSTAIILAMLLSLCAFSPVMATSSYPLASSDPVVADALNYLRSQQDSSGCISDFGSSAWITMAITAVGEDPHNWTTGSSPSIVDYLATNSSSATSASDFARMILAIAAADEDPASFWRPGLSLSTQSRI